MCEQTPDELAVECQSAIKEIEENIKRANEALDKRDWYGYGIEMAFIAETVTRQHNTAMWCSPIDNKPEAKNE